MAAKLTGPSSHHFISQRLKLHFVDWGNESAPPLLLVHGGLDHCRNWDWLAQALREDYHIIAPDLRGHGDSAWEASGDYTKANYVFDLAQLLRHTQLGPVSIIGHSFGGMVSMLYAAAFPDTVHRLVVIEGILRSTQEMDLGGSESWIDDPEANGSLAHFRDARSITIAGAGHWVHHDQLDAVIEHVRTFLAE